VRAWCVAAVYERTRRGVNAVYAEGLRLPPTLPPPASPLPVISPGPAALLENYAAVATRVDMPRHGASLVIRASACAVRVGSSEEVCAPDRRRGQAHCDAALAPRRYVLADSDASFARRLRAYRSRQLRAVTPRSACAALLHTRQCRFIERASAAAAVVCQWYAWRLSRGLKW